MAQIRNPYAYANYLAKKQMGQQQNANIDVAQNQGVDELLRQRQLAQIANEQRVLREQAMQQQEANESPLGAYQELFGGQSAVPGSAPTSKSAIQELFPEMK